MTDDKKSGISVGSATAKGAISQLPILGPVIAELINQTIPDRRIERLADLFNRLEQRVANVEPQIVRERFADPVFAELVEDAMFSAVRAASAERRQYIAEILGRGLSAGDVARMDRNSLLRMLDDMNDAEVLLLCFHGISDSEKAILFYERHQDAIEGSPVSSGETDPEEYGRAAVRGTYEARLLRLGLLEMRSYRPSHEGISAFDDQGRVRAGSAKISLLGRVLLREIGQLNDFLSP
jgi:hypothetical protein